MNILVLGGSGLFGRKIIAHLVSDKEVKSVVAMDVVPPPAWLLTLIKKDSKKFTFVKGDVSEIEDILSTIQKYSIDRIVNMAYILTGAFEQNPRLAIKVNLLGMCNVFEAARLMGIKRVVYASSVGVYGPQEDYGDREVTEDDSPHPINAYGVSKQMCEMLAQQYHNLYGIEFSAVRPFLGYGHGGAFPPIIKIVSELVSLPAVGIPVKLPMPGSSPAALSSADDVAALVKLLVKAPKSTHPAYNVASPPTPLKDVAQIVKKYIPDAKIEFAPDVPAGPAPKGGLPGKASMARAKKDLGFTLMPLEESVLLHINDARIEAGLQLITA